MEQANDMDYESLRAQARWQIQENKRLIQSLKELRRRSNVSQEELAFRMGITQPAVSAIEKGNADSSLGTIRRYANALGYVISYEILPSTTVMSSNPSAHATVTEEHASMAQ
ncbi:transcriptional regulator [Bifidobacterium lemurum]|uniref:Transcriptional regulator n=1 Tax=Bifidobacterium lemurum TaxID=1603886 RepID=A0A261FNV3_9BIFI|nr:helix-turn-helix transcriptional regulator [Bifidobacterium lemurum]OZG60653.1 transcriptional regulator [Bifidobacterium lemurum]QOL34826.1 helix-turn-helix transcriptional regulator [Bifidobacterium lemurum]